VDEACIVRTKYVRVLNRKFKELADSKEEEAFNMCKKRMKIFDLKEFRDLEKLEYFSL
jgi:hypothetical protein